jgi:Glycosyltransferase family 87
MRSRTGDLWQSTRPVLAPLILLVLATGATLSLLKAYRDATSSAFPSSMDFQWSGSHLLLQGIDPWQRYLQGTTFEHMSVPNYAQEFYVLLLPFGAMEFSTAVRVWYFVTVALSIVAVLLVARIYALDRWQQAGLLFVFWGSLPFRNGLSVGQHATLILVLFLLVFFPFARAGRGLALGLSFSKYSFVPVIVPLFAFRRELVLLAWAIVPPALGLLVVWMMLGGNVLQLAIEPLLVNRTGVSPGAGDIMTLISIATGGNSILIFAIPAACAIGYAFMLSRQRDRTSAELLACSSVATLLFFKHLIYDYVFLVVPVAYAVRHLPLASRSIVCGVVAFFWYIESIVGLSPMTQDSVPLQVASALLLVSVLGVLEVEMRRTPAALAASVR